MKNSPKNFYNVVDKKKLGIDEAVAVAGEVEQLKTTVGDSSSGLVKQVNDLQTTVDNIDYDISRKADIDGSYPDMTVGNADQLNSTQMITDTVPYVFRTSGGSVDIGDRETDKIIGGTIAFNQLIKNGNFVETSNWSQQRVTLSVSNNIGSVTLTDTNDPYIQQLFNSLANHKYLYCVEVKRANSNTDVRVIAYYNGTSNNKTYTTTTNDWEQANLIVDNTVVGENRLRITELGTKTIGDTFLIRNTMVLDLTAMFGTTIADYIYNLEQSQAGAGVAWFKKLFPKSYYAYNAGELMSVKTSAHNMVGFNAYNNATGKAKLLGGNEYQITGTYTAIAYEDINGNAEVITPDASGIFTPTNNGTMTVTGGNDTDTCIHLTWTGYRNGEFEPYIKRSYTLDDDLELRGIAKVDGNGNIYYDGDTYSSDGTVIRNYEIRAYASGDESLPNAITDGTNTVVKLDTPVEESADPFHDPQWVDDFGTEEYVDTRAIPVPVGHITQYPANLRDKIQHLPSPTGVNGDYIIREDTEVMTLVPAPTGVPELPSVDGTYVLTCTVSDGTATLSWTSNA